MKTILTITSKGQTTLPVAIRRKLGLTKDGGRLRVEFNENRGQAIISKPIDAGSLSDRFSKYIKPGAKPIIDVSGYYQKHRKPLP